MLFFRLSVFTHPHCTLLYLADVLSGALADSLACFLQWALGDWCDYDEGAGLVES